MEGFSGKAMQTSFLQVLLAYYMFNKQNTAFAASCQYFLEYIQALIIMIT